MPNKIIIFIIIVLTIVLTACEVPVEGNVLPAPADVKGKTTSITCYSGGKVIYEAITSSDLVNDNYQSYGYSFIVEGKRVRVSGTCIINQY